MRTHVLLMASLLLVPVAGQAADNTPGGSPDAQAAFARLSTLVGEWQADTSMGRTNISYELVAGGSVLLERESGEKMPVMMTMYHLDGDRLILTHYCAAGNQPRMQARSFDAKAGVVQFEFLDITNLASKDAGQMRNATIRLVDNDHFTADWEFYAGGQRKSAESFQYRRVH